MVGGLTPNTIHQAANPPSGYSSTCGAALVSSSLFFIPESRSTMTNGIEVSEVQGCFFNSEPSILTAFNVGIEIHLNGDVDTGWRRVGDEERPAKFLRHIYTTRLKTDSEISAPSRPVPFRGHILLGLKRLAGKLHRRPALKMPKPEEIKHPLVFTWFEGIRMVK